MKRQSIDIIIKPGELSGSISGISSKSVAHRALIIAALCEEKTKIYINEFSKDILVTIQALKSLGAEIEIYKDCVELRPSKKRLDFADVDLYESGSSLRFLIGVSSLLAKRINMYGEEGLIKRPIKELLLEYEKNGLCFSDYKLPFEISGELKKGNFKFKNDVSSQYISSAILAYCTLEDTIIEVDGQLESKGYVDITIDVLKDFGGEVIETENSYLVKKSKLKSPEQYFVEMDYSNAAFFLVASALGKNVDIMGLRENSKQRDREILNILKDFGAEVKDLSVRKNKSRALDINISQIPDLVPILAVLLASIEDKSYLRGGKRLKYKESNRLVSTAEMINNLGGSARIIGDDLEISGPIIGGEVDSYNDHRIVMAASIASVIAKEDIIIKNADAVNKSYPNFFEDFKKLGGNYDRKEY